MFKRSLLALLLVAGLTAPIAQATEGEPVPEKSWYSPITDTASSAGEFVWTNIYPIGFVTVAIPAVYYVYQNYVADQEETEEAA